MWTSTNTDPTVSVQVAHTGDHYDCHTNESLLKGMLRLGRKGIPVGCANGGCGVCKVRVLAGGVRPLGPVSRAHVSQDEEAHGYTLACRAAPTAPAAPGDCLRIEVSARLAKPFSRPRPDAVADSAFGPGTTISSTAPSARS